MRKRPRVRHSDWRWPRSPQAAHIARAALALKGSRLLRVTLLLLLLLLPQLLLPLLPPFLLRNRGSCARRAPIGTQRRRARSTRKHRGCWRRQHARCLIATPGTWAGALRRRRRRACAAARAAPANAHGTTVRINGSMERRAAWDGICTDEQRELAASGTAETLIAASGPKVLAAVVRSAVGGRSVQLLRGFVQPVRARGPPRAAERSVTAPVAHMRGCNTKKNTAGRCT